MMEKACVHIRGQLGSLGYSIIQRLLREELDIIVQEENLQSLNELFSTELEFSKSNISSCQDNSIVAGNRVLLLGFDNYGASNDDPQLGIGIDGEPHGTDRPEDAEEYAMSLQAGDYIIMGTDGLFDNLWSQDIVEYINEERPHPKSLAKGLADMAYEESQKKDNSVPFFHRAKMAKQPFGDYQGGKEDDISVIVSYVD